MKLHYISKKQSVISRIFSPVQQWSASSLKHSGIGFKDSYEIPQWQKDLVLKRVEAYENGAEDYLDLQDAMREIEKDL